MNPYELIIGAPPSSQDQIRAAAARLRGADDRSVLAMLSGDPTLQGVGQAQYDATQKQAHGLSKARAAADNLTAQREMDNARLVQQAKLAEDNNVIQRSQLAATIANQQAIREQAAAQIAATEAYRIQQQKHDEDVLAESRRYHDLRNEEKKAAEAQRAEKEAAVNSRFEDMQLSRLADKIESTGISDMEVALDTSDKSVSKYFDPSTGKRTKEGKEIPGFGGVENMVPTWASGVLGEDAQNLRLDIVGLKNRALKIRSGSAVTDQELQRLAMELGDSIGQGEEQMIRAYVNFRRGMNHVKTMMYAGRDPKIVQQFMTNRDALNSGAGVDTSMSGGSVPNIQGTPTTRNGTSYEVLDED
jgi:hypothetical protein